MERGKIGFLEIKSDPRSEKGNLVGVGRILFQSRGISSVAVNLSGKPEVIS